MFPLPRALCVRRGALRRGVRRHRERVVGAEARVSDARGRLQRGRRLRRRLGACARRHAAGLGEAVERGGVRGVEDGEVRRAAR